MKRLLNYSHPFLFALFPVIFLHSHNINELWSIGELSILPAITLITASLLLLLCRLILRDIDRAALIVSFFLFLFFSYGYFNTIIWNLQFTVFGITIGRNMLLFTLWIIILIIGITILVKKRGDLQPLTSFANIAGLLMIAISLVNITVFSIRYRISPKELESGAFPHITNLKGQDTLRDIYYIMLDRYASAGILKSEYLYDNSEFVDFLKNRGFYVASRSTSNYPRTGLSLASSLNMEYINYLSDIAGEDSRDAAPFSALVKNHRLGNIMKSLGYRYIHFGSTNALTKWNKQADVNFSKFMIPEFTMTFYKTTMLYPISEKLNLFSEYTSPRSSILGKFERLAAIPDIPHPVFVFTHILLPHPPYIFDRDGNAVSHADHEKKSINELYIDQLIFTNKKLMALVDSLLTKTEPKPVIVLQSDEGPFPSFYLEILERYKLFKYRQVSDRELRHKMEILNAYYLPGKDTTVLYPTITPVNSFRLILNLYFNAQVELLPDKNYAIEDENHPYAMFEVTERLIHK